MAPSLPTPNTSRPTKIPEPTIPKSRYIYQRIKKDKTIRLFTLLPSLEKQARLEGWLRELPISSEANYKALSYTWGKGEPTEKLYIYDKVLPITPHLATALRVIRGTDRPLSIWVDQMCINQRDAAERSKQVRYMQDIYQRADEVLVYLGPDPMKQATHAATAIHKLFRMFSRKPSDSTIAEECKAISNTLWEALRSMVRQDWFSRVWIMQEIGTSTSATIHWGSSTIRWMNLYAVMEQLHISRRYNGVEERFDFELREITDRVTRLHQKFLVPKNFEGETSMDSFVRRLQLASHQEATDPRDYIFSQLGHYSAQLTGGITVLKPDYSLTRDTIYHQVAVQCLKHSETLEILNLAQVVRWAGSRSENHPHRRDSLPSWAPSWHNGSLSAYTGLFEASSNRKPQLSFTNDHKILCVHGAIVDEFANVSHTFTTGSRESKLPVQKQQFRDALSLCHSQQGLKLDFSNIPKYRPDQTKSILAAFLDTMVPTAAFEHRAPNRSAYLSGRVVLERVYPHKRREIRSLLPTQSGSSASSWSWVQVARVLAPGRRFAITTEGHFVLTPPQTKKHDVLCVLFGGATPYVLRKCGDHYRFVGEAFAYGFMAGEAIAMLEDGLLTEKVFKIC